MAPYSFTTSQKGGVRVVIPFSVKEEEKKRDHQTTTQKVFTEERKEKKRTTHARHKQNNTNTFNKQRQRDRGRQQEKSRSREGRKEERNRRSPLQRYHMYPRTQIPSTIAHQHIRALLNDVFKAKKEEEKNVQNERRNLTSNRHRYLKSSRATTEKKDFRQNQKKNDPLPALFTVTPIRCLS
jgi:hypothetical protein